LQFLDIRGRTRNLRLTAEQMHITQPAATKILVDIEEIFEARLFDRLPRVMRPNELGWFLLRYAAATLAGQKKFLDEFSALKQGGHGHVAVGAISGAGARLLTAAVQEAHRRRPLLVLKLFEQSSDQLIAWLAERKIDFMIGRFTDAAQRTQFHYERLSSEPLCVVAGPQHPLRDLRPSTLQELATWPWILYPPLTALRKVSDAIFSAADFVPVSGVVETASFLFAFELLQSTSMLSLQPAALVGKYVERGLLARIPVAVEARMPDYGLVTRLGEIPAPAAQELMDILRGLGGADAAGTPC
jgi:DNA-binding transcriptional LysR family regulator